MRHFFPAKCLLEFVNLDGYAAGAEGGGSDQADPNDLPQVTINTIIKQMDLGQYPTVHSYLSRITQMISS